MPQHVIVDGSNLATEGRTMPSLQQLKEAISSYRSDHPDVLITVVVDATFGHRIDPKEVNEFEKAIETNEYVAPPAGAVGRGDGFILNIAQKANASILSNDSYQEFHGEFEWLFDEGRLIGGKPVPHVGWVFVNRVPVRGPVSRRSVKEQKIVEKSPSRRGCGRATAATTSGISADAPMPVPTAPPPGATLPGAKQREQKPAAEQKQSESSRSESSRSEGSRGDGSRGDGSRGDGSRTTEQRSTNDLLAFLSFVEHYPVGTAVTAVVETYSSHGAYVSIGDVKGYVPLRMMAEPAPRSAREVMELGERVTLVVASFAAARRSIDLAVPGMVPAVVVAEAKPKRGSKKVAAKSVENTPPAAPVAEEASTPAKRGRGRKAAATPADVAPPAPAAPAKAPRGQKKAAAPRKAASKTQVHVEPGDAIATMFANAEHPESVPAGVALAAPSKKSSSRRRSPKADTAPAPAPAPTIIEPAAPAKKSGGRGRGGSKRAATTGTNEGN